MPELLEAEQAAAPRHGPQSKRAVVMIARLQPPTEGHYKVIDAMKRFMREEPALKLAAAVVVVVDGEKSSADKARNPLSAADRVKFIEASGRANGVKVIIAPSAFAGFDRVRALGFEPIAIAAGSDRADAYLKLLDKYFGIDQHHEPIKHLKVPGLDRVEADSKTASSVVGKALEKLRASGKLADAEVSGSMARRAVELDYQEEFAAIVGLTHKPKLAKLMFNKIKASMGESNA